MKLAEQEEAGEMKKRRRRKGWAKMEKPRTYLQVIIRDGVNKVVVKMCATCRLVQHSLQVWMHVKKKKVN